jgi:tRNA pseudouridine32 synthase/23S rRNA pseudouridine746 synthase
MSRPPRIDLPVRDGVSASTVATPSGPWPQVLDFLAERIPAVSRAQWAERMARGEVLDAQGQALPPDSPYRAQTRLHYWRALDHEHPVPFASPIVFQDDWLVVADKPHFLAVTPKGRHLQETLLVRLKRATGIDTLSPMHRIDLETAGLVVFTVQPATRHAYQDLLRQQRVHKAYEAIAPWHSDLQWPQLRRSHIGHSAHFMATAELPGEPNSATHIEPLEVQGAWARYHLRPVTGRKHQLRVHMNALGLPIAGDRIYPRLQPAVDPNSPPDFSRPLQLLAKRLAFDDPITGAARVFESQQHLDLGLVASW